MRCFFWTQNSQEVNYSGSRMQGWGGMHLEEIPRTTIYGRTAYNKRQLFNTKRKTPNRWLKTNSSSFCRLCKLNSTFWSLLWEILFQGEQNYVRRSTKINNELMEKNKQENRPKRKDLLLICTPYCQCCIVQMLRELFGHYYFLIKKSHNGSACFCVRVPLCLPTLTSEQGDQFSQNFIYMLCRQRSLQPRDY